MMNYSNVFMTVFESIQKEIEFLEPGLDTGDLESWISSYLDPLENVLLWAIPVVLAIYLLIKAITWVQKESEGEQQPPYWVQVKRGIIVGIIAESVDLLLKVFSISG